MNGEWLDLGEMEYVPCGDLQVRIADEVRSGARQDTLLLVRHPPVLTLGAGFQEGNLLHPPGFYTGRGIGIVRTDRGGDVTYHGPGQLVIYPVFDLTRHGRDVRAWLRDLEETMILVCASFGIEARRFPPHTGTWIGDRKVAAIGVKVRKWVSIHGIALNCDTDLSVFDLFVPCGIRGFGVTSLSAEIGRSVTPGDAVPETVRAFEEVLGIHLAPRRTLSVSGP
jgi:lipoyl(octanoyl) transferase